MMPTPKVIVAQGIERGKARLRPGALFLLELSNSSPTVRSPHFAGRVKRKPRFPRARSAGSLCYPARCPPLGTVPRPSTLVHSDAPSIVVVGLSR